MIPPLKPEILGALDGPRELGLLRTPSTSRIEPQNEIDRLRDYSLPGGETEVRSPYHRDPNPVPDWWQRVEAPVVWLAIPIVGWLLFVVGWRWMWDYIVAHPFTFGQ